MRFTKQWMTEWLGQPFETESLIRQLTMAGLEVDEVGGVAFDFSGVVVAEVIEAVQHPDADKLRVCQVNDGENQYQVVCGAPNVRPGLKVPFARIDAELGNDKGEKPFRIKKAKLRGVESFGMLCSAEELGLAESSDGLLELAADAPIGEDVRAYLDLDDQFLELDLTPNRGDCLSMRGLAREVSVLNRIPYNDLAQKPVANSVPDTFPVKISATDACHRYLGRVIKGINIKAESPLWMQEKLRRCGLRSIDPVVDVTNYVLLELGQPMHAFDLDELNSGIQVRYSTGTESLTLLDGKEVTPEADTLLIADAEGPLALAGIMGGESSAVSQSTQDVFLECACFNPLAIAGKARKYGLHTDSSHRYERGVDPELQTLAMERATALLLEIVGGEPGPVIEVTGEAVSARTVSLQVGNVARLLGKAFSADEIVEVLTGLGVTLLDRAEENLSFAVPSYRYDLAIEADLIEELARIYGYENMPVRRPTAPMKLQPQPEAQLPLQRIRSRLVDLGYQQVITYSFVSPELLKTVQPKPEPVPLQNPISSDMSVMRTSLLPGLLSTLQYNVNRQQHRVRIFENGQVFLRENAESAVIEQPERLAGLIYGPCVEKHWSSNQVKSDFYDLKGDVESLLDFVGDRAEVSFAKGEHPAMHPGQCADVLVDGQSIGQIGKLNPRLQRELDIADAAYVFELTLDPLLLTNIPAFESISRFPETSRDLAWVVDRSVQVGEMVKTLTGLAGEDVTNVQVLDVFESDKLGQSKKSVALGLTWQHPSRTLGDDEINAIIDRCVKGLEESFNAELRN